MSAVEVDGQIGAMAGLSRSGSRPGSASGQDDGAFGAMMADLDAPPASGAKPATRDAADAGSSAASEEAVVGKGKQDAGGLDDLLSKVLAGTAKTEDAAPLTPAEKDRAAKDAATLALQTETAVATDGAAAEEELADAHGTQHGRTKARAAAEAVDANVDAKTTADAAILQAQASAQANAAQSAEAAKAEADADSASGEGAATGAAIAAETEAAAAAVDVPTMRVKVLSRETHFAPVRTWSLSSENVSDAEVAKVASDEDIEGADAARSDAFAASPRERAAMRLEQARMQDPLQGGAGGDGLAVDEAGAQAEGTDALLASTEATGTSGSLTQGAMPLSSLRQVSTAIGAEVARLVDPSFVADTDTTDSLARGNGPLRIIAIQLQPLDLGTVTVRMRMSDDGLDVRISASNPATARMLQQDQARLTELLQAQGIDAATVTVTGSSDQAAAWSRFEALPRSTASNFSGQGDGDRSSGQQQGQQNSGNGRDEGEDASGDRRSRRNSG